MVAMNAKVQGRRFVLPDGIRLLERAVIDIDGEEWAHFYCWAADWKLMPQRSLSLTWLQQEGYEVDIEEWRAA
jgi:hypothetical protein